MIHARPDELTGRRVPPVHRAVPASGEDRSAIRAEGQGPADALTIEDQPEGLAGVGIPDPDRIVATGGEKALAIGAEGSGHDRALMHQDWSDRLFRHRIPEPRRLVLAPGEQGLAVGAEGHGPDLRRDGRGGADPMGCPVATFHSRAAWSPTPVPIRTTCRRG